LKEKTGVTVPTEVADAIEGFDAGQVTSVLKDKCAKVSGSDAAFEEAQVSEKLFFKLFFKVLKILKSFFFLILSFEDIF
jgi:hypothetical protein